MRVRRITLLAHRARDRVDAARVEKTANGAVDEERAMLKTITPM